MIRFLISLLYNIGEYDTLFFNERNLVKRNVPSLKSHSTEFIIYTLCNLLREDITISHEWMNHSEKLHQHKRCKTL